MTEKRNPCQIHFMAFGVFWCDWLYSVSDADNCSTKFDQYGGGFAEAEFELYAHRCVLAQKR